MYVVRQRLYSSGKEHIEQGKTNFEDKVAVSRNVHLRSTDFEEHGTIRGCPECDQTRNSFMDRCETSLERLPRNNHS